MCPSGESNPHHLGQRHTDPGSSRKKCVCGEANFASGANSIGRSRSPGKNISISDFMNPCSAASVPRRQEGRTRRHERGAECGGRGDAVRRAASSLTVKSCGPGAPMHAPSSCETPKVAHGRRWQELVHRGEREVSRKPSRREGRCDPACTCGSCACAIVFCARPRVHAATRPSLRPPFDGEGKSDDKARATKPRECGRVSSS